MIDPPTLWLIAGPNGVGKTTYAFNHIQKISGSTRFINLDEIARGLSPLAPEQEQMRAARIALEMMDDMIAQKRSFSIETTLSGRTHLHLIKQAKANGFMINLLFFIVQTPEICVSRIARRVSEGGHNVSESDVRRRFNRSIDNFQTYAQTASLWRVFDNDQSKPHVCAEGREGCRYFLRTTANLPEPLLNILQAMPVCAEN
jgi:predicted ABC-type ATPase